jgi:hypothetical protein
MHFSQTIEALRPKEVVDETRFSGLAVIQNLGAWALSRVVSLRWHLDNSKRLQLFVKCSLSAVVYSQSVRQTD